MAVVTASAPVVFASPQAATAATGTGTTSQIFQVSSAGVTAGLTAGNFYLVSPPSNVLNGRMLEVTVNGWVKAHGATQKIGVGLQCFPWNTTVSGAITASGTETSVMVASSTLTAGTVYDFSYQQKFFGDATANTLTCETPVVYIAGSSVSNTATTTPITVAFATASQTEPITGINTSYNYPLASFAFEFVNYVSDTTETMGLTSFNLQLI